MIQSNFILFFYFIRRILRQNQTVVWFGGSEVREKPAGVDDVDVLQNQIRILVPGCFINVLDLAESPKELPVLI